MVRVLAEERLEGTQDLLLGPDRSQQQLGQVYRFLLIDQNRLGGGFRLARLQAGEAGRCGHHSDDSDHGCS